MADHTQVSSYGPISTKTQATQTLPVQTQPPTQLMSHELHQFTQLIDHDSVEHVHGDTMVNYSALEGPGNTLVLDDDAPPLRSKGGSSPRDADAQSTPCLQVEGGLHIGVTAHGTIDAPSKEYVALDSDATTEEGDIDGIGYLDADAESRPTLFDTTVDTEARSISIASGHTAPSQSASLESTRKDDVKFDSDATVELTPGVFNGELTKPFEAPHANKAAGFDSMQSSPKAVLPSSNTTAHSPHISDHMDLDATIELDTNAIEGLCPFGRVPGMPKTGIDRRRESMSNALEPLTLGLKRYDQDGVANDASPGANVKEEPSTQKARELAFETSLTTLTDKLEGGGNAVSKALETECVNASGKPISVIHALTRDQQFSFPSGFRAASTNLSYIESQEPGEETQVNAFNMVDKLVWLDTACFSDDIVTSPVAHDGSIKDHAGAKGRQSLAQAAQMKTVRDKLDVFDWEDSQVDKADTLPDAKQVPVNIRSQKWQSEAYKPKASRKKQATSDRQKMETIENSARQKNTPDVAKTLVEPSSSNQDAKPHTLLTTRLRNRTKAELRPSPKGRKSSSLKSGPSKRVGRKKQIEESDKDFETGKQKGSDNMKVKVQQAGLVVKSEPRKSAGRKKSVDESGKDLKIEQQKDGGSKGNKFRQADSLSAKGKKDLLKTSKLGPEIQGNHGPADRTSQDDAAADIWIAAFANTKNKTTGSDVELIKFRKRRALPEGNGQDLKKRRTMELATVSTDEEQHQDTFEKEETPLKEKRVEPESNIQQDSKRPENIAKISRRRVSTRLSQGENQDLEKKENNVEEQVITKSKKPRTSDTQVKIRRVSTRTHQGDVSKREDILMKQDKAEPALETSQDPKQCITADVVILSPVRSGGVSTCGSEVEHLNIIENTSSHGMLERGPRTRSKAQDLKKIVAGSDAKKSNRAKTAVIKSNTAQATTNDKDEPRGAMQADIEVAKPSSKTSRSKKKESSLSHQHLKARDAQEIEADPCQAAPPPIYVNEGVSAGAPKTRKRRREAEAFVPESTKAGGNSVSQPKEEDTDKHMSKMEDLECSKKGDVSKSTVLRRTRRNMCDGGSQKNDFVDLKEDGVQCRVESATEEQTPQNLTGIINANKGQKKQVAKSDRKTTKSMPRQNKKTPAPEMMEKLNRTNGGRRRKREPGCIRVLFSHNLTEDKIKHQKKILAKLGGHLAMSASDCTHFVSNGFVRTQNMLISIATGKIVATPLWLENCGQAHYFVDAKKYILQDKKKEKELGFSMAASLASAERKPLLKGFQVLVCSNTVPEPAVLQAIVESAGGQVMDIKSYSSLLDAKENDASLIIIANEKDVDFCLQFLDKGLKVYSEELVLHGIVTQTLDFSRNRLFEDFKQ